ncbi:MAG: transcriptional regulator [Pseudonocardiales bacterium]|nr:MAG: transcriptional regulator [Pseudonocardiales bacterium]
MDRAALADLLRSRRERLTPADIGLPPGIRRRTPGLRRDEVAGLAAISTDYYTRLEQQRGPHPSAAVLASLARALRFTDDERDHLFHLAGQAPPSRQVASAHLSPGLLHLLDRLTDCPAMVVDDLGVVLRQNAMSLAVTGDMSTWRGRDRYSAWRWFCVPGSRARIPQEDWDEHSRTQVAELRATHGRRGADPDVAQLVTDLNAGSAEFAGLWDEHVVAVRRADAKRVDHPEVGLLDLLCETLVSAVGGQTVVVLYPRPGTGTREKLDLLRVIGLQDLSVAP